MNQNIKKHTTVAFSLLVCCPVCYPKPKLANPILQADTIRGLLACTGCGRQFEAPQQEIVLSERLAPGLSESAQAAIAWLRSPAADGLTAAAARLRIRLDYGADVALELVEFFNKEGSAL